MCVCIINVNIFVDIYICYMGISQYQEDRKTSEIPSQTVN